MRGQPVVAGEVGPEVFPRASGASFKAGDKLDLRGGDVTITLPGLETLCRGELAALEDPPADLRVSKGGVAFQGRLTSCYQANLMCRTASRVLMRIQQCKARHFDELEERVRAVPWELYLKIDVSLEVRASIRRSKLYHSQAVSERILRAVSARLALHGRKDAGTEREGPVQCIWARLQEDRLTLSLDSSGDPLHKRGIKTTGGPAPLRETLAAGALPNTQPGPNLEHGASRATWSGDPGETIQNVI